MMWKRLFALHILERGYDYYLDDAVENIEISEDMISAIVVGSDDYEVEISLDNEEVTEMYCSCPYASDGKNCKHMAAVLYEWSASEEETETSDEESADFFQSVCMINEYKKKVVAVEELVKGYSEEEIRSFLVNALAEDERLLLRFYNLHNKQVTRDDINNYIKLVDRTKNR